MKSNRIVVSICFLLALMVWGVFGQTLRYEFVNYDDGRYVYENPVISKGVTLESSRWILTHPHGVNWHPLTSFSHMLDCQIYGLAPGGHHGTNVLLHMATAILLFLVLRQITGSLWRSAVVTALFAIHPLRVESVAWISERKDVLSGLFFMLTLGAYIRYVRRPFSSGRYATIAVFFILGMMSKPMLVTLPFVLLLLDFWPLGRFQTLETKKTIIRPVLEKIPLLLLSAVFCGITVWAQRGAISIATPLPVPWRFGNAFCSYAIYIKQMIFPFGLALLYPHQETNLPLWEIGISVTLLAGISWGVFAGRKKYPYLITGWFWYLGMLAPVIGIMQVGPQAHADRYTYLPQIGLAIMAVWLTADWCTSPRYRRAVLSTAAAAVLTLLAVTAHRQTRYWHDSVSLWTRTLTCTEGNCLAQNNLGGLLGQKGQFKQAILHFEKALEINPDFADPSYNLGVILGSQGQFDKAIPHLEKALAINPNNAEWHCTLGIVFTKQTNFVAAIRQYERALQINLNCIEAENSLAEIPHHELKKEPADKDTVE
ncbi:MAG: tetratricopeptide repeat protein [Kiritimatiellaeota bacterium]|nr:tetratricopeptide repeat protein [Kiritimatiellota bacterium]